MFSTKLSKFRKFNRFMSIWHLFAKIVVKIGLQTRKI